MSGSVLTLAIQGVVGLARLDDLLESIQGDHGTAHHDDVVVQCGVVLLDAIQRGELGRTGTTSFICLALEPDEHLGNRRNEHLTHIARTL